MELHLESTPIFDRAQGSLRYSITTLIDNSLDLGLGHPRQPCTNQFRG